MSLHDVEVISAAGCIEFELSRLRSSVEGEKENDGIWGLVRRWVVGFGPDRWLFKDDDAVDVVGDAVKLKR